MGIAVETHKLSKMYPPKKGWRKIQKASQPLAVRDISLTVNEGELFGLLGPNGAGKTTLVKMLCTLIMPTSGTASILGYNLTQQGQIRAEVGLAVTDERSFYWRLSARRNLRFFAELHGLSGAERERRIDEVLDAVHLRDRADVRFSDFSTGMKQRMAIARSLLHHPRILFLDEPSRSLDPTSTAQLHDLVLGLMAERGMTVFLITHDMAEAEKLCNRIAIIDQGVVKAVGDSAVLRHKLQASRHYQLTVSNLSDAAVASLHTIVANLQLSSTDPTNLSFDVSDQSNALTAALDCLRQHDVIVETIDSQQPTLEDLFAQLTNENA